MGTPLEEIIKDKIRTHGPMSVGQFMAIALGHPEYGYYMKQDPFGRSGDFVTAPEVSQLLGEMIGVWVADIWMQMDQPESFILLECGPGRGTLMADIMRATAGVGGFHAAARIHLLEMSPVLKAQQARALENFDVEWCDDLNHVPDDAPMIVVANEFLDALPFKQFADGQERQVVLDGDELAFSHDGDVNEVSPAREGFVQEIGLRLKEQDGAALFIDYGHSKFGAGDTFQAVKDHEFVDVFSCVGDADLTSHVDFEALSKGVKIPVHGPIEQGAFLEALGIDVRAQALMENASAEQVKDLEKGLHRLIHSDQMGSLFKVLAMSAHNDKAIHPAGF